MIKKKSDDEIAILRVGGKRLGEILRELAQISKVGVTTGELDQLARDLIAKNGDEPAFLNYQPAGAPAPFPAALCVSINDEVVHGIPGSRALQDGDVVSLDLGLKHGGLFTDSAITIAIGDTLPEVDKLITATREALDRGIEAAVPGAHLSDIGAAIEKVSKKNGLGLVRDLGGHGVGYKVHEEPMIANFGPGGSGLVLEEGLVLAIEPMLNLGGWGVKFLPDGYTVKTADGSLSAHFEHTVVINRNGAEVLTR
ncbi:type I methionyl aminopeptidase [Candidatus Nomurabacteria bacterium]|nr:type I methionyl aminopeptidase [Candidatus Nomurabacteria bacterium]